MFNLKRIVDRYDNGDTYIGGGWFHIEYNNGVRNYGVCIIQTWTMGSCAARNCSHFNNGFPWTDEIVEEFLEFLETTDRDMYHSREVYFFITTRQIRSMGLDKLIVNSGFSKIDAFTNRGNGGDGDMQLWRWSSCAEDLEEEEEEADDL